MTPGSSRHDAKIYRGGHKVHALYLFATALYCINNCNLYRECTENDFSYPHSYFFK